MGKGSGGGPSALERLSAADRRSALLDVAKQLVLDDGAGAVTMGTVAERAAVTRALVYKHFANKEDILRSLYRREATTLDRHLARAVADAPEGFEPKLRAFIRGVLDSVDHHGQLFGPLRGLGVDEPTRRDRRSWDRRTVGYFADLATATFALDERTARSAISILFSGVSSVVAQAQHHPDREFLEDTFVTSVVGALARLGDR